MPALTMMIATSLIALATIGCAARYERSDVGVDSDEGRAVVKMLAELRAAGPAQVGNFIIDHAAGQLTAEQSAGLKATLTQFAAASTAQLVSLDRFGPEVYRAGIKLTDVRGTQTIFMLLVRTGGKLRWAGAN